ncbi:MAG: sigma-70 family RNA polymerase sigma factor [Pedobacter sp.]|nr:sigma-70 family RNA polymerase sigma factor [Chitinophagaceae bacterium]
MAKREHFTTLTDEQLVLHYQQHHEQKALAVVYLRYYELVYGVCVKYLKDQDLAKDAVMTIYEELTTKLLKHDPENFKAWLYILSKHHCLMQLRRQKGNYFEEISNSFMQLEDNWHLEDILTKEQHLSGLEHCIEQLNTEQQQTIKLFYLEEKCYNDITEITGLEWNKVRSLIQNGKRNLKICMDKNEQ